MLISSCHFWHCRIARLNVINPNSRNLLKWCFGVGLGQRCFVCSSSQWIRSVFLQDYLPCYLRIICLSWWQETCAVKISTKSEATGTAFYMCSLGQNLQTQSHNKAKQRANKANDSSPKHPCVHVWYCLCITSQTHTIPIHREEIMVPDVMKKSLRSLSI